MTDDSLFGAEEYFIDPDYAESFLFDLIKKRDVAALNALLLENPQLINAKTKTAHITPLMYAAGLSKNEIIVEFLLSRGANVNARDSNGCTAIMWAVCQPDNLRVLISKGADVNLGSLLDGRTPLMRSVASYAKESIELLISSNADINAKDVTGRTAIALAKSNDDIDIVDLLHKYGGK